MSSIEIVTYILARNAAVKAKVGNNVFPIEAKQGTDVDYITVNEISSKDHDLIDVAGRYYRSRVSVECISTSALNVISISEAVENCLVAVTKQNVTRFTDVDIRFADVSMTDPNDARTAFRATKHFHVWWRTAA